MNLQRIGNSSFIFKKDDQTFCISVPNVANAELRYNLAKKVANLIETQEDSSKKLGRFRYANAKWKISRQHKHTRLLKFLSSIFDFFPKVHRSDIIRYKVDATCFGPRRKTKILSSKKQRLYKAFKSPTQRAGYRSFLKETNSRISKTTINEYKMLVRGKAPLTEEVLPFDSSYFQDPFTLLSTRAFQNYEKEFLSKDDFTPEDCKYRLIKKGNNLLLVNKKSPLINEERSKAAVQAYKKFLIDNFGEEKIAHLEHLYRFKLDEVDELTPEHIYRMNVGITSLDYQDVDDFLIKLEKAYDCDAEDFDGPLRNFLEDSELFTRQQVKSLFRFMQEFTGSDSPTVGDFLDWLEELDLPKDSIEFSPKDYNQIVAILKCTPDECDRALTGRKIFPFIRSGYTDAELNQYKPWVDQHQLTQFLQEMLPCSSTESYYEKLSHVISKLHLAREHPTEGFRVGTLIPAPPLEDGEIRWYKVTSCVSNGHGAFSFTLESACDDPTLPAIKLYRSTASSPYAMHSRSSVVSDFNNLNSPGHQGMGKTDKYEESFFKQRTIPVWVGYGLLAKRQMEDLPEAEERSEEAQTIFDTLQNANLELFDEYIAQHKPKSMEDILRHHDGVLNDLYYKYEDLFGIFSITGDKTDFPKVLKQLSLRYVIKGKSNKDIFRERRDARNLIAKLKRLKEKEESPVVKTGINNLIADLELNILQRKNHQASLDAKIANFKTRTFGKLEEYRRQASQKLEEGDTDKALKYMRKWEKALENHAKKKGEDPATKISTGLAFSGHSLGGALSQAYLVHWTAEKGRMPMPSTNCTGYFFDDPAINQKTNVLFKKWGNRHCELFNALDVNFRIVRRQEAGDFVPTAGEEHLGATFSEEEAQLVGRWLKFDAAVLRRSVKSTHSSITSPLIAHETRFLDGQRKRNFYSKAELRDLREEWVQRKAAAEQRALGAPDESDGEEEQYDVETCEQALSQIDAELNRSRDYLSTHYTSLAQGIFDRQGKFKKDESDETYEKEFHEMNRNVWHLHRVFKPMLAEDLRKSVSFLLVLIRKYLLDREDNYPLDEELTDRLGNFAVSEEGVISRRKAAEAA